MKSKCIDGTSIVPPVRCEATYVYNAIYDAENKLITFISIDSKTDANTKFLCELINSSINEN